MKTKNLVLVLALLWVNLLPLYAQMLVSVNKAITQDTLLANIQMSNISSQTVIASGQTVYSSKSGYVRILLSDDYGYDLLLYESFPLVAVNGIDNFNNVAVETVDIPSHLTLTKIRVEIKNAELSNLSVDVSATTPSSTQQQQTRSDRIAVINNNLHNQNALWVAGETSVSQMSYQEKKVLFGGSLPDLQGFEYYVGGIFELNSDTVTSIQNMRNTTRPSFVSSFDWRNRHGKNWLTSVKNQNPCGTCWVYGAIGAVEGLVNLYYNQKIDLDLSEQQIISCTGNNCSGGGWSGDALNYITTNGVVNETCFPNAYTSDPSCNDMCSNPAENIKIAGMQPYIPQSYSDPVSELKKQIIQKGIIGGRILNWNHAMTLVGFGTMQAGDIVYNGTFGGYAAPITIGLNDPRIGQTYWIFKNSWGNSWGSDDGYLYASLYAISDTINQLYHSVVPLPPITSLNYTDADIICEDRDGDGYYFWGIGPKPVTCPCDIPEEPDGDDSDPNLGPMDACGNCKSITADYITTSETWNTDKTINKEIIIQSGAALIITSIIYCSKHAKILVAPGGKLVLNGATLTNLCPGEMWQGIELENSENKQSAILEMDNSLIENTICAVKFVSDSTKTSGIESKITATNSTFKNNCIAINIQKKTTNYTTANSTFLNCTFLTNVDYFESTNIVTPNDHIHVKLYGTHNKNFYGCNFTVSTKKSWRGIVAEDAGFTVREKCTGISIIDPCDLCPTYTISYFSGFDKAIDVNNVGNQKAFTVKRTNFAAGNKIGINVASSNNYSVSYSNFNFLVSQDMPSASYYGIYSQNSSGYEISDNNFHSNPFNLFNSNNNIGIVMCNSGTANNIIHFNTFENLSAGMNAIDNNGTTSGTTSGTPSGLTVACNDFSSNIYDISLALNSTINPEQGCATSGVNNSFTSTKISSIFSNGNQQINYYHNNSFPVIPYNPSTAYITLHSATSSHHLQDDYYFRPLCLTAIKERESLLKYLELQGKNEDGSNDLEMMLLSNAVLHALMNDSVEHLEELKDWYSVINTPIAKYSLAETHFALEEYLEAENVLAEIPAKFQFGENEMKEHTNYLNFFHFKKNLTTSNRSFDSLSESEILELEAIATATNGRSATMARGVLCFFYGICFEEEENSVEKMLAPTDMPNNSEESPAFAPQQVSENNTSLQLSDLTNSKIYPNPTTGVIYFDNPKGKWVSVYDELGKLLQTTTSNCFDLSKYPNGNYYIKINNQASKVVKK